MRNSARARGDSSRLRQTDFKRSGLDGVPGCAKEKYSDVDLSVWPTHSRSTFLPLCHFPWPVHECEPLFIAGNCPVQHATQAAQAFGGGTQLNNSCLTSASISIAAATRNDKRCGSVFEISGKQISALVADRSHSLGNATERFSSFAGESAGMLWSS